MEYKSFDQVSDSLEDVSIYEVKHTIKEYLNLATKIKELEIAKTQVSPYYYAKQSLIGVASADRDQPQRYQRQISPEHAAMDIISEEQAIQKQIDRLTQRYKKVIDSNLLSNEQALRTSQIRATLTLEEVKAYQAIQEVEKTVREEARVQLDVIHSFDLAEYYKQEEADKLAEQKRLDQEYGHIQSYLDNFMLEMEQEEFI